MNLKIIAAITIITSINKKLDNWQEVDNSVRQRFVDLRCLPVIRYRVLLSI